MSFVSGYKPTLDAIRTSVPTGIGLRSATLTVRKVLLDGPFIASMNSTATDTVITGPSGNRYKVRELTMKEVASSGGLFKNGDIRVGPITPPYPGGAFTKADLIPPPKPGQEVYYGITDASGQTQWCSLAAAESLHDLHWYLTLNPTGTNPQAPGT